MKQIKMEVSKNVAGKYQAVGEVDITVPTLEDCGLEVEIKGEEEGLPVYAEDRHNWLQGAIFAAVKAAARNKLVSGTASLKPGAKIAATWEELCTAGERIGNAAALLAVRECKTAFAAWVATIGKSAAAQHTLTLLFGNRQALTLQAEDTKAKMQKYVLDFAETLNAEQSEKFGKYLQSLVDACEAENAEADDF